MKNALILKGQTLSFSENPFDVGPENSTKHYTDGAVLIENGKIQNVGPSEEIIGNSGNVTVVDYGSHLITAGFIDCHAHYPQIPIIASYGEQLLEWLEKYTFPVESRFCDKKYARSVADLFLKECLKNGITSSSVYATVHQVSVDAFFEATSELGLRMACGKVMMDRNAPDSLCDTPQIAYDQSKELIEKWHGIGRNLYAITPRFAPTSSQQQLEIAGALWKEYPSVLMQTHLAENSKEISWVTQLFPDLPDYFGVYEKFGLVGQGAIFGHGIHLNEREKSALQESSSSIAHCPTSNMFIGSGLFDISKLNSDGRPITIGLGTDIAGGSSLSMFATMKTAYETAQLCNYSLHPAQAWYLATIGSASAMKLENCVGNLLPGMEADIIIINLCSTPLIQQRIEKAYDIWDILFAQIILADERAIRATYVDGKCVFNNNNSE